MKGQHRNQYPKSQRQSGRSVSNHPVHSSVRTVQKHTNGSYMDHGGSMHNPYNHLCRRDQKPYKQGKTELKRILDKFIKIITPSTNLNTPQSPMLRTRIMDIEHTTMKKKQTQHGQKTTGKPKQPDIKSQRSRNKERMEAKNWRHKTGTPNRPLTWKEPKSRPKGKSEPKHKTPKKSLTTTGKFKSKIQHLLNGKQEEWKPGKKKQHINKLTRKQASTIFKARTRMLNVKNNYRNNHQNTEYRMCKNAMETHTRGVPSNSLAKHTEKRWNIQHRPWHHKRSRQENHLSHGANGQDHKQTKTQHTQETPNKRENTQP